MDLERLKNLQLDCAKRAIQEDGKRNHIGAIAKNYLERHRLRSIYRSIISVNVLD